MDYVKRRANTTAKVSAADFEACKSQFLFGIATITEMEDTPNDLVINWNHTGSNMSLSGTGPWLKKGAS